MCIRDRAEIDAARDNLPERVFQQEFMAEFIEDSGGVFRRVQATSDLPPADLTGVATFGQSDRRWQIRPSPLFHNGAPVEAINRPTPRTPSPLHEATEARHASAAGAPLSLPFFGCHTWRGADPVSGGQAEKSAPPSTPPLAPNRAAAIKTPQRAPPLRVRSENQGRHVKVVSVITGVMSPPAGKEALLKWLKTKLGTGGALKDGNLEIQGDHREKIVAILNGLGTTLT